MRQRKIIITISDMNRLRKLLESALNFLRSDRPYLENLEQELTNAQIVATGEIPQNIVALNSRVRLRDLKTGEQMVYTLVFPKDSNASEERLSVLAPIGTAILGQRAGDIVECRAPARVRKLKIEEVTEVSGGTMPLEAAA